MMLLPLVLLLSTPAATFQTPSVRDRAVQVVAQKARMSNRYTLKLRQEGRMPDAPPPNEKEWRSTLQIWREGNKIRVDHFEASYAPPRLKHDSRNRRITCENCEREGHGITTTVLPGSPAALHLVEFKLLREWNHDTYCTGFDWRYFGLINLARCGYSRAHVAESFPDFFIKPVVMTNNDRRGGLPCLVTTQKEVANNLTRAVWMSERDEYHPVCFQETFDVKGVPETRTTEIDWQRTVGGHLFPKRVKHNAIVSLDGTRIPMEEVTYVLDADFESPIDPTVFTVAGFGLNEGQVIGYPELKFEDQPRWKNGKVDYTETASKRPEGVGSSNAAPPTAAPYPSESSLSTIVGSIAAVLAVVAAAAAFVVRRRRASA